MKKLVLAVSSVPLRERVSVRIIPDMETVISEIRFWHNRKLAGITSAKNEDLNIPLRQVNIFNPVLAFKFNKNNPVLIDF